MVPIVLNQFDAIAYVSCNPLPDGWAVDSYIKVNGNIELTESGSKTIYVPQGSNVVVETWVDDGYYNYNPGGAYTDCGKTFGAFMTASVNGTKTLIDSAGIVQGPTTGSATPFAASASFTFTADIANIYNFDGHVHVLTGPVPTPSVTPSETPAASPTPTPSETPAVSPDPTPSVTPSATPAPSLIYLTDQYSCGTCTLLQSDVIVSSTVGLDLGEYFLADDGNVYFTKNTTTGAPITNITDNTGYANCINVPCSSGGQFTLTFSELIYDLGPNKNSFVFTLTAANPTETLAYDVNIRVPSGFVFGMSNTNANVAYLDENFTLTIPAGSGDGSQIMVQTSTGGAPISDATGGLFYVGVLAGPARLEIQNNTSGWVTFANNDPGPTTDAQTNLISTSTLDEVNLIAPTEQTIVFTSI